MKLRPDRVLHRSMLVIGLFCIAFGAWLIATLPVGGLWRTLALVIWIADGVREMRQFVRGAAELRQIAVNADGGVCGTSHTGRVTGLTLLSGTFVTANLAWFRVGDNHRLQYAGLFLRSRVAASDWHRLQLIWQQRQPAFGHPRRA